MIAKNSYTKGDADGTLTAVLYQLYVWHEKEGVKARGEPRIGTPSCFDSIHDLTANARSVSIWKTIHTVAGYRAVTVPLQTLVRTFLNKCVPELWRTEKRDY